MKSKLAVFNGTGVNRYGMAFTVGALESGLEQSWKYGLPSCISHDLHRLIAWSKGMSLYLEPGLVRLAGLVYSPEDKEDEEELQQIFQESIQARLQKEFKPHSEQRYKRLSKLLSKEHSPLMPACAALVDTGLAMRTFPEIFQKKDKNGLIPLAELNPIGPGAFEIDGLLLFAHPFFRRSLSRYNSLNTPFLARFQEIARSQELDARIGLDPDMVGLASTYNEYIELEYWWGPKFTDELSDIDFGVTKHVAGEDQKTFHGISATEFWWHNQNEIRTFECEEIRDIPSFGVGKDSFGCRYVHSMLDKTKCIPNHMDGAIRLYDESRMIERIESDISKSGKNSNYYKLWRIDGELKISVWKELLNDYFRDNRQVGEYLGGEDNNEYNNPHELITTTYSSPLSKFIPCNMEPNDGIRISVSYHEKTPQDPNIISFIPADFITTDDDRFYYIEYDSTEVAKLLRKKGYKVVIPNDTMLIAFEDMLLNFPRIHHSGEESISLAQVTQDVFLSLCTAWASRRDNRVISFTISIEYADKEVYFSFAGHVTDLVTWFKSEEAALPTSQDMIGQWAENASRYIDNAFKISIDSPPLHDLLKKDGMHIFPRRFLKNNEFRMRYEENTGSLISDLMIPKDDTDLFEVLNSGKLTVACAYWVRDSKCSKCHASYNLCNCSKFLEEDVVQNMTDVPLLGAFWTNRKA